MNGTRTCWFGYRVDGTGTTCPNTAEPCTMFCLEHKARMNTKQFINKYSGAALDAYEIAELAVDNLPADNEIRLAAEEYLHRKDQFFFLLETLGFEIG